MDSITIHAGDFVAGPAFIVDGHLYARLDTDTKDRYTPLWEIDTLEIASDESVKRLAGTLGWGLVGSLALGGIGALAGALAGGNKKMVTFIAQLKDGKRLLASTKHSTFVLIQAIVFDEQAGKPMKYKPIDPKSMELNGLIVLTAVPICVAIFAIAVDKTWLVWLCLAALVIIAWIGYTKATAKSKTREKTLGETMDKMRKKDEFPPSPSMRANRHQDTHNGEDSIP